MTEKRMQEDRQLLELAAKAAGIEGSYFHSDSPIHCGIYQVRGEYYWNPLISDSEALRLAVKLHLHLSPRVVTVAAQQFKYPSVDPKTYAQEHYDDHAGDAMSATRRAIVRAAASLAKDPE